jgi:hypothetical protein
MNAFDTAHLTPMQLGRLNKALDRLYRFSDGTVATLRAKIESFPEIEKTESDGMIKWSRSKFNSLDGRGQDAYEARLKAERLCWINDMQVPVIVYDATRATVTA